MTRNSFDTRAHLGVDGTTYAIYRLDRIDGSARLPYSLKVLLENLLRQHAEGTATLEDIGAVTQWLKTRSSEREIGFKPARVLMVDSSSSVAAGGSNPARWL